MGTRLPIPTVIREIDFARDKRIPSLKRSCAPHYLDLAQINGLERGHRLTSPAGLAPAWD